MSEESKEWGGLVDRHLRGEIAVEEFEELKEALRSCPEKREDYLSAVKMDALLREIAGKQANEAAAPSTGNFARGRLLLFGAGLVGCCVAILLLARGGSMERSAAEVGIASGARWLEGGRSEGDVLRAGDVIGLASGSVEVRFRSGALTRIHGPARFEITSDNGGFLHHGQAWARADTESSEGFTIRTHSGKFVDRGTEFLTTARTDGFSQMQVTSGAVDAEVDGFERQRFEKGSGIGIEPGDIPVVIRIESGSATPDFSFPTIPPPSGDDDAGLAAGRARARVISRVGDERLNLPHQESGPAELLLDGKAQTAQDQPGESLFLPNGAEGMILIDLGREVPVSRIHTYSWHLSEVDIGKRRRAVQRYTLWACGEVKPESLPIREKGRGWTRVARVDTDAFFRVEEEPDRPAQQACSIRSNGPAIGKFRYLLFQVFPTPMPEGLPAQHTFFGEIDVFAGKRGEEP